MANFTVTSNNFLRNLYSSNRELVNNSARVKVSVKELGKADSKALSKGISTLESYDYDSEIDDSTKFYKTLKSFADSYNNTVKSGTELAQTDSTTKRLISEMKKLKKEHGEELESYGISFDDKGYMSISTTAIDHIKVSKFKEVLGEDSEFLSDLSKLSKRLTRRINYLA